MNYAEAVEYQRRMNGGELVQILTDRGVDVFKSDKRNAGLRAEYGDTPYAAPDVDPGTGHCGGGDAWPLCCEGHRFAEWVFDIIYTHQSARKDEGETFDDFDWESTLPNCAKSLPRRINCKLTDAQWEHLSHCVASTAVYLDDEIADGLKPQSARGVHDRMWDKILGIE